MSAFVIEFVEQKKSLLYLSGAALDDLAVGQVFQRLEQGGERAKSRKKRATVALIVESIIWQGEPVETLDAPMSGMIAVSGDPQAVLDAVADLRWKRKSGRFLRTGGDALILGSDSLRES